jgi:hypothetical protein
MINSKKRELSGQLCSSISRTLRNQESSIHQVLESKQEAKNKSNQCLSPVFWKIKKKSQNKKERKSTKMKKYKKIRKYPRSKSLQNQSQRTLRKSRNNCFMKITLFNLKKSCPSCNLLSNLHKRNICSFLEKERVILDKVRTQDTFKQTPVISNNNLIKFLKSPRNETPNCWKGLYKQDKTTKPAKPSWMKQWGCIKKRGMSGIKKS